MLEIESTLNQLRAEILNMWSLVQDQLDKAQMALLYFDKDLVRAIRAQEKRVNALELKIDRDCEHLLALQAPVAVDLRFVLAILKINTNLERIGDIADSVSQYIFETKEAYGDELLDNSEIRRMFDLAKSILASGREAFEHEDTRLARTIFRQDETLNNIKSKALPFALSYLKKQASESEQILNILSMIRKLERVGDHTKNIAEEIIFYVEAKVLKHKNNA